MFRTDVNICNNKSSWEFIGLMKDMILVTFPIVLSEYTATCSTPLGFTTASLTKFSTLEESRSF